MRMEDSKPMACSVVDRAVSASCQVADVAWVSQLAIVHDVSRSAFIKWRRSLWLSPGSVALQIKSDKALAQMSAQRLERLYLAYLRVHAS